MSNDDKPDWFNLIAAERGMPSGWSWFHSEWRGEGPSAVMLVKGGVSGALFMSGPKKGRPNPAKRTGVAEIVVSRADMLAIKTKWERETGACFECAGEGEVTRGWSKEAGRMTCVCPRCKGKPAIIPLAVEATR